MVERLQCYPKLWIRLRLVVLTFFDGAVSTWIVLKDINIGTSPTINNLKYYKVHICCLDLCPITFISTLCSLDLSNTR